MVNDSPNDSKHAPFYAPEPLRGKFESDSLIHKDFFHVVFCDLFLDQRPYELTGRKQKTNGTPAFAGVTAPC